ncbi:MAG TPA: hypothetical protein VFO94_19030 [Gammaproteobacteria bacterium]|nr:hypothetical protein [Gammaproteobacteria bacterium]
MPPRKTVEEKLDDLDGIAAERNPAAAAERLKSALADRHFSVVAKAAKLAAAGLQYDLRAALAAAYRRLLDKPAKSDPNCIAKKVLARALVDLDFADVEFFAAGLSYRQLEPVWGGTADTAAELRSICAMGLVASGYSRALMEVTPLLYDPEPEARIGAVRAIACGSPREAELLLRAKVASGDAESVVLGECFSALLGVEPDESLPFVGRHLGEGDDALREHAALALGESRLAGALPLLQQAWGEPLVSPSLRRALLRAAAMLRSEAAFDWLIALVGERDFATATDIVECLALYKHDTKLAARLLAALATRGDAALLATYTERWAR